MTTSVRDSALLLDVAAGPLPGDAYAAPEPTAPFTELARRDPGRLRIGLITALPDGPDVDPCCVAAARAAADLCTSLGHRVEETGARYRPADVGRTSGVLMGADLVAQIDARLAQSAAPSPTTTWNPSPASCTTRTGPCPPPTSAAHRAAPRRSAGRRAPPSTTSTSCSPRPRPADPAPRPARTTDPESLYTHAATYAAFTSVHNVTGMPAMSFPFGHDPDGLPLEVQFASPLGTEGTLLALATQLESTLSGRLAQRVRRADVRAGPLPPRGLLSGA